MALIVTIIVLLILAGVSIATLAGNNGLISRTTIAKEATRAGEVKELVRLEAQANKIAEATNDTNYTQKTRSAVIAELVADGKITSAEAEEIQSAETPTITIGGIAIDFSILPEFVQVWSQNEATVTDGDITLDVGSKVTGYSVTVTIDEEEKVINNWYVLGAKNGKLLLTTNTNPEKVSLIGSNGYLNGVAILTNTAAKYSDEDMANDVRVLELEDINRITGFDVNEDDNYVGNVFEYGNEVTYTLKNDGKIWYQGTKQPEEETISTYTKLEYVNGTEPDTLKVGESVTVTCTMSGYRINSVNDRVKDMLFKNTGYYPGSDGSYWLGGTSVNTREGYIEYSFYSVYSSDVSCLDLFPGELGSGNNSLGIRPVVSLKPSVKVTEAGVLTK